MQVILSKHDLKSQENQDGYFFLAGCAIIQCHYF